MTGHELLQQLQQLEPSTLQKPVVFDQLPNESGYVEITLIGILADEYCWIDAMKVLASRERLYQHCDHDQQYGNPQGNFPGHTTDQRQGESNEHEQEHGGMQHGGTSDC